MTFRRMFQRTVSPVVADFGSSSVKLLQIAGRDNPSIIAARLLEIPDEARCDTEKRFAFLADELPGILKQAGFRGRRILISPASSHFMVQETTIDDGGGLSPDDQVRAEVAGRIGCAPESVVARSFPIPGRPRERVALAIAREEVMRHLELLKRSRFDVIGVQPDHLPLVRAFDHIHRRDADHAMATMYVDAGWSGVKVAVTRGTELVFARIIHIGGRQFDEIAASAWESSTTVARKRRIAEESRVLETPPACEGSRSPVPDPMDAGLRARTVEIDPEGGALVHIETATIMAVEVERRKGSGSPTLNPVGGPGVNPDLAEVDESIADELLMCARYARAALGGSIDRLVMVGGESHSRRLAGHLARRMGVKSSVGDPIRRLLNSTPEGVVPLDHGREHPEWAIACGLCACETGS